MAPSIPQPSADVEELYREIRQLRVALVTRDMIGQAKGVIRAVFQCDEGAAFAALARLSQDTNCKVSDVARLIMSITTSGRALNPASMKSLRRGIDDYRPPRV